MNNRLAPLEAIEAALNALSDPETGAGLMAAGRVAGLSIRPDGRVSFTIEAPSASIDRYHSVREAAEAAVRGLAGVTAVTVVLTAHGGGAARPAPRAQPQPERRAEGVAGVASVIAVASAKGGVGKSTVAVNFACALAKLGKRVGLLDVDVYGPSLPTLMGTTAHKPEPKRGGKLAPVEAWGLKTMSIGYLVDPETAMVWRGPMATSAIRQMLDEVDWAPLDILVLDLPPGTGDAQLTLVQRLPLAGVVIVSTPQQMALADVRRGIGMFEKTHAPILGVVENMAWYETPSGERVALFGEGGARRTAEEFGVPFLGEIPLDVRLREASDEGKPLVAAEPGHPIAERFLAIATAALANMAVGQKPAPAIRFE
ncbi:MAG: Mrp/NBP35 family ATP-binding protein [Hyphomonadaceae bacterium]|nr:Mrp/NBP35 family ATP-binding protein [Hyphomonadaceae bacterium]